MNDWWCPNSSGTTIRMGSRSVLNDEDLAEMSSFFRYDALNEDFVATRTLRLE